MDNICKNCGAETEKSYCSSCGQSTHTGRINLHEIAHEFLHGIIHVDKGIFYTIKELTLRPGQTIRGYFDGKRVKITKPFGYFFILATLYVFIIHFSGQNIIDLNVLDSNIQTNSKVDGIVNISRVIADVINKHYALIILCTIPLSAGMTAIMFRRQKYNYGEHLVMNSYIMGHQILFRIILIPLDYIFGKGLIDNWALILQTILLIYMLGSVFNTYKLWKRIVYPLITQILMSIIIGTVVASILIFYVLI